MGDHAHDRWRGLGQGPHPPRGLMPALLGSVDDLAAAIDRVAAEAEFCGGVRVDRGGDLAFAKAYGLAHRAYDRPNSVGTRFAIASGTKGLTALTIASLIE